MRHNLVLAAAALALAVAVPQTAAAVSYKFCMGDWILCRDDGEEPSERWSTVFDLGIEVNHLPLTKRYVTEFMATLTPRAQYVMYVTCQNYVAHPRKAKSVYTIPFCTALLSF
jgi:hypothetical protein